ncbi:hypothetical protein Leryth_024235 [Lithospermum erythrorhizon]|nr:hypothetical protein Leryth_024235 [Lithospermum erythrorhizon]
MPIYQPSKRGGLIGYDGSGGQVLDVDTAVRDGVLGGIDGGRGGFGGGVCEKLDLKKLIEELDLPEIPSVFICPISLEPMQDPVTLCTGQTYERGNILKWFSLAHYTCPTTMQELWDDTITPNSTLYHLIYTWFSQKYLQMKKISEDFQGKASELITTLKKLKGQARVEALQELRKIVATHTTARKTVVDEGGVELLSTLLGPYTSHAVGSEVIAILVKLTLDSERKSNLMQPGKVSLLVDMLSEGSTETKLNCIGVIQYLMEDKEFMIETISSHRLFVALMRLVRDRRNTGGQLAALMLLKLVCLHKSVLNVVVSIGSIPQLIELLPGLNLECLELTLFILEALSSVPEGRGSLKECLATIPNLVKLIMRYSEVCTEYALSILWSVCKLSPEECSSIAVDAGLAAKLLLVIQSGCSPELKQRAAELLKLCSLNYSDSMFISKCKLTRTIQ